MHGCPNCGQMIEGTYDENGVRWDICEDCFEELNYENDFLTFANCRKDRLFKQKRIAMPPVKITAS